MIANIVGKIYSVACKNFVTYDDAILYPGEYLNVILGPNGTGKSTLVAAIILGMGGKPKVLSRSSDIQSYVKNGMEEAWIEIKIFKNQSRHTIAFERIFNSSGKSVYKIDGVKVDIKEYLRQVYAYKIQVDNLCQFLPQDRVQDFAKMNPQEILKSTLNSICDQDLIESFEKLKELRNQQLNEKKILSENEKKLKEAEQRNDELKEKIEQMTIRNKYLNEIEMCLKKKAWCECSELKNDIKVVEKDLKLANAAVERNQKQYDEIKQKTKGIQDYIKNSEKEVERAKKQIREHADELDRLVNISEELEQSIRQAKMELNGKISEENEREGEIADAIKVLEAVLEDYKNATKVYGTVDQIKKENEALDTQAKGISLEIKKLMDRRRNLNRELDEDFEPELQATKRKIFSIENIKERRLNMLRDRFEPVYKAVVWLRQNRHLFEGEIYEPMILELNVKNEKNAKYFENSVSIRDLLAFTCVNKSDLNLLIRKLCNEQKLQGISVLHSEEATVCKYRATEPIENFRKYGFYSYLIDMVEGPAPILNYLCRASNIHMILVGTDTVNEYADELPSHIYQFFTPNYKYNISHSKYTNEKCSMRIDISPKNILCMTIDQQKLNQLKENFKQISKRSDILKNERSTIEGRISAFEEQKNEVTTQKNAIEAKRFKLLKFPEKIRSCKQKVDRLKNDKIDIKHEEAKFKEFAARVVNQIIVNQRKSVEKLKNYQKSIKLEEYKNTSLYIFKHQHSDLANQEESILETLKSSQNLARTISHNFDKAEAKYKEKLHKAMEMCEGKKIGSKNFPYTEIFSLLPKKIDELQDHLSELQARLDCMGIENPGILEDYESRRILIENLKQSIESALSGYGDLETNISRIHDDWHPKVVEIVEKINHNFSRFMTLMDYAGEVQLWRKGDHDYDSYGIQILVQYRNSVKLQILDRFVQSGGERAVAIAVYTLSLQHLTNVPFRCVDEINQGMDSRNERKIFELLVEETSKEDQPQYFFISPKLLPNLNYNELMTIHVVFNGKFIANNKVFTR